MVHLPRYDEWRVGTPAERIRIARANLRDNPLIVAYWFHFRFETYKKIVLTKKFGVRDTWDRYEWQGRGSTHDHAVFWLDGAPSPEVDGLDEATHTKFTKWWALYISAWNPEPRHGAHKMDEIAATALPVDGPENRVSHLSGILNRVQRHQCSEAYCLRKDKDTGNVYCRFHFPWPLRDEPDLAKPAFSKFYRLHPCRNDPLCLHLRRN